MQDARRTKPDLLRELRALREELAKAREEATSVATSLESAETYRDFLEAMRAFLVEIDREGRVLYVSPSIERVLGYKPEEYLGRGSFEIVHEDERAELLERFRKTITTGEARGVIFRDRHKDGHFVWMHATGRLRRAADGSLRVVSIARDVSDLEQARAALRESEERFQAMAEKAFDLITEIDGEGTVLFMGANCRSFLGVEAAEIVGHRLGSTPVTDRVDPEDRERFLEGFRRGDVARGARFEARYWHPDGRLRWLETTATSYHTRTGEQRAVLVTRDATERIEAERRLRQSEERYRVVAEATRDLITEQDPEGRITYASPACEAVLGYRPEELVGTYAMLTCTHPDDLAPVVASFERCAASQGPTQIIGPYRVVRKDGSIRWCEGGGVTYRKADGSLSVLGVTRDVSERVWAEGERRELERSMQRAQRLESLGILAGGVAHDFNNLLTPILGEAGLALVELPAESPLRPHLESIQKAARRAAALADQMLAYAGQRPVEMQPVDLSSLVRELGDLLASAGGRRSRLVYELASGLPEMRGDAAQIGQVAMNLITNAAEALGEGSGSIRVRTGTVPSPQCATGKRLGAELGPGEHVFLEVEDTGCGMDEGVLGRIFEPFFTTKFTGRGLGLAAALGIVRSHGGAIEIESTPGVGSRFRVLFPAVAAEQSAVSRAPAEAARWQGSGTVLLVDDDAGVRAFADLALRRSGLEVVTAADAREAVELYARRSGEIDVVVLDRTLPGAAGDELLTAIRRIRPDAGIVLISGYAEEPDACPAPAGGANRFLRKPFTHEALAHEVRSLLEARAASQPLNPSRDTGP
jgi:PAS domain S-box-containing protein